MMEFGKRFKIGTRVLAGLCIPVLGLLYFLNAYLMTHYRTSSELTKVQVLTDLAPTVSALIHELQKEREQLQGQLVHSQRMEAVGQLAGGVAHDFNNLLHAMQGNLDLLEKELEEGTREKNLARNINTAAERAARLTEQMLGFARGA